MSVWLPDWSIDLVRRRDRKSREPGEISDSRPLLLYEEVRQQQVVACCCRLARRAGVRRGMPVTQARALFDAGEVRIEPHSPARDGGALHALAGWAHRLSPIVALDPPDGLLMDMTGCEAVYGGETRLVRRVMAQFARLGLRTRAAVAPTFACAWAVARYWKKPMAIVLPGRQRQAMAALPIAALNPDPQTLTGLAEVGIERIGQLLELPRAALPARFGDELLLRLDRALGSGIEAIRPVRPELPPSVERVFDGPTDRLEAILRTVRDLLAELCTQMLARESGARSLDLELARSDLPPERIAIVLGRPSRNPRHLWSLLAPKLENAHLGFGVERVRLHVASLGRLKHEQAERWEAGPALSAREMEQARGELLDTLENRLGHGRVLRFVARESHAPERAFAAVPAHACHAGHATHTPAPDRSATRKKRASGSARDVSASGAQSGVRSGVQSGVRSGADAPGRMSRVEDPSAYEPRASDPEEPMCASDRSETPRAQGRPGTPALRLCGAGRDAGDHPPAPAGDDRFGRRAGDRRDAAEDRDAGPRGPRITPRDRPTIVFGRPLPAEVVSLTPDGPVHRIRWRGEEETVVVSRGPERIGEEWWRAEANGRPYRARGIALDGRIPGSFGVCGCGLAPMASGPSPEAGHVVQDIDPEPRGQFVTPANDYFAAQCQDGRWLWIARGVDTGHWAVLGAWG